MSRLHLWQPHTIYSLLEQDQIPTIQTCIMFSYNIFNIGNGEGCLGYICGNHTQSTAFWNRTKYQYKHVSCLTTIYLMLGMVRDVLATFVEPHTIYSPLVQDQTPTIQICIMFSYNIFNVGNGEGCFSFICGNHTQSTAFWHRTKYLQYQQVSCLSITYLKFGMVRDVLAIFVATTHNLKPSGTGPNTYNTNMYHV